MSSKNEVYGHWGKNEVYVHSKGEAYDTARVRCMYTPRVRCRYTAHTHTLHTPLLRFVSSSPGLIQIYRLARTNLEKAPQKNNLLLPKIFLERFYKHSLREESS